MQKKESIKSCLNGSSSSTSTCSQAGLSPSSHHHADPSTKPLQPYWRPAWCRPHVEGNGRALGLLLLTVLLTAIKEQRGKKNTKKNQHNKAVKIQDYLDWMLWALTAFLQGNHWFFFLLFLFICLGHHQTGCQLHKQKLVVHYKWTLDHFPEDLPQDSRWFWFSFGHRMLPKISIFPEPFIFYKE